MVTGAHGGAGEVGHITLQPSGRSCEMGCDGCLEGMASGAANARDRIDAGRDSSLREMAGGDSQRITTRLVFEAALQGDALAKEVVDQTVRFWGMGFGGLLNTFDPEALIIGGGVAGGLGPYWNDLVESVKAHSLPRYRDGVPMELSILGAAVLTFRKAGIPMVTLPTN